MSKFFKRTQSANETPVPQIAPHIDALNIDKLLETINRGVDDQVASLESTLAGGNVATTHDAMPGRSAVSVAEFPPDRAVVRGPQNAPEQVLSLEQTPTNLVGRLYQPGSPAAVFAYEQYRVLRTRLQTQIRTRSIRTLLITSAMAGEGKSTVSSNLAFVMSQVEGRNVLLVDADLRRPTVANLWGLNSPRGLSSYLSDGLPLNQVCWRIEPQLSVVPTAPVESGAAELLSGERMKLFLQEARQAHDLVILDAPPLFPIADAQVLGRLVDAVVLVVGAGQYPAEMVSSAADLLRPKLLGAVLNGIERLPHNYSRYGYGYIQPSGSRRG